ncbi:unnamed protein product [Pylaiella littoralis]
MPRPIPPTSNKSVDGRISPASPRWAGVRGSGSSEGMPNVSTPRTGSSTSRRGGASVSSPRGNAPPPGGGGGGSSSSSSTRGYPVRDQYGSHGGTTERSERSTAGSISRSRKSFEVECAEGGREEAGEDSGRIRVAVRVRPFSEKESLAGTRCIISMAGNQTKILDPTYFDSEEGASSPDDRSMWERTFSFDHSFWSHSGGRRGGTNGGAAAGEGGILFSSQADVHQALGIFLLDNACKGFNCSLFAYGQTGSGKTYTMLGDSSDLTSAAGEGTAGLIPRICVELFQRFGLSSGGSGVVATENASRVNGQASIKVSFCEIYNEQVGDLFGSGGSGHGLRVREHPTKGAFVEGLSARPVSCYQQVQQLLEDGMSSRATAATAMNEVSSRSHAIFTIHITVTFTTKLSHGGGGGENRGVAADGDSEDDVSSRTSKICLVDLAGSERANATGAKGDRLREAANINKSLSTLGDVIKALAKRAGAGRGGGSGAMGSSNSDSFIPYRNSMLTWLLKDSIGGNSKTVMLAAISPVAGAYQETMSTLRRYVERAKEIVNSVAINDASANPLIGKLREEVRALQELLEEKEAVIAERDGKESMLTAALERARAGDDEKVLKALADADYFQAALHAEMRDKEKLEATAVKRAQVEKGMHARELEEQAERHATDFEECLKQHEEEINRVKGEAAEMLAFEVGLAKDRAWEERATGQAQWEEAAELERVKAAKYHEEEMEAALERHRVEIVRVSEKAADAAARTAEVAFAEISELQKMHDVEIAENAATAEAVKAEELRRLREEFELEGEVKQKKASEARLVEQAERDAEWQSRAATAAAAADESRVAALKNLREQHDASFVSLREDHTAAVTAAVEEATERLSIEHRKEIKAVQDAAELSVQEARLEESKSSGEELVARVEAALSALRRDHERELAELASAREEVLEKTRSDAKAKLEVDLRKADDTIAAVQEEIKLVKKSQLEQLAAASEERELQVRRATEDERAKAEAKISEIESKSAAAIEALELETDAARTAQEQKHREEIRAVGEQLEVEIKVLVADSENRERKALQALAGENEAIISQIKTINDQLIATLEAKHGERLETAEQRWRDEMQAAVAAAEKRGLCSIEEAELRAAAALAAEQGRHREEIAQKDREVEAAIQAIRVAAENERVSDLAAAEDTLSRSLAETKNEHAAAMAALKSQHREELNNSDETYRNNMKRLAAEAEKQKQVAVSSAEETLAATLSAVKAETTAATASREAKHQAELRRAQEEHKAEVDQVIDSAESRREADMAVLRRELAQGEDRIKEISEAVERKLEADSEGMATKMADVESAYRAELARLADEHTENIAVAKARAEAQRAADISEAESRLKSSVEAIREEMAEEKAKFVSRHLLEMRKVKEEGAAQIERASREATERSTAQEAKAAAEVNEAKAIHLSDLKAAAASAEEARNLELAAASDTLASTTSLLRSEMENAIAKMKEQHRDELRKISEGREAEKRALSEAADERHVNALADANAAQENKLQDALQAERLLHAEAAKTAGQAIRENLESEHRRAVDALEEAHRAAMKRLEKSNRKEVEKLEGNLEAAQTAAADAQASADELATRAEALDEMLKASVGSNEEELAGHRSRVAQLQGFVARREALVGDDSNKLSQTAARSLQQRFSDLRAIDAGNWAAAQKGGNENTGPAAFSSTVGVVEGLTTERYAEELEIALIRATVEAAAARQDHLEADTQFQGVTRQLVGLKLVHAQLRECLEDTQAKLEHKSQSAARRLLNSAARLAYEFAKPDRFSSAPRSPGSPSRSTKPRAMSSQSSGGRSPLSRTRGGALRRQKTPGRDRESAQAGEGAVSREEVVVDFSATM